MISNHTLNRADYFPRKASIRIPLAHTRHHSCAPQKNPTPRYLCTIRHLLSVLRGFGFDSFWGSSSYMDRIILKNSDNKIRCVAPCQSKNSMQVLMCYSGCRWLSVATITLRERHLSKENKVSWFCWKCIWHELDSSCRGTAGETCTPGQKEKEVNVKGDISRLHLIFFDF